MKKKIFTWHVHGSYLYYLTQADATFYIPVNEQRSHGYGGRAGSFPWGDNVIEVPVSEVKNLDLDCILFQSKDAYLTDQYDLFSETQLALPKIYIEHDPPRETPTDTRHVVDDPEMLLVHVTHFNNLMWDNNRTPSVVIEHGVTVPEDVLYTGKKNKGIVVINNLLSRGRRLGSDVFQQMRKEVPLDLVGMGSTDAAGLGEVPHTELPAFEANYRFFFNPIRYTSLGLSVCEAMMIGMPVVGLATTEMTTTITSGENGYISNNFDELVEIMDELIANPQKARQIGANARERAREKFSIQRFSNDWETVFELMSERDTKKVIREFHPMLFI